MPKDASPVVELCEASVKQALSMKELSAQLSECALPSSSSPSPQERQEKRHAVLNRLLPPAAPSQAERIKQALEWQRDHRNRLTNQARKLARGDLSSSDEDDQEPAFQPFAIQGVKRRRDPDDDDDDADDAPDTRKYICLDRPRDPQTSTRPPYAKYANQVMFAEAMTSLPDDFSTDWVLMVCPVGKRCLVTATNGQTVARAKSGRIISRFQSQLPNGSIGRGRGSSSDYSILDCVYDAANSTFYVLDIMCWKGYAIYDCDTDFRHFWLQTKIHQLEDVPATAHNTRYTFQALVPVPTEQLALLMRQLPHYPYNVDGLLLYHRRAQYTTGSTPLVGWVPREQIDTVFGSSEIPKDATDTTNA
ncbi:hypothetical protein BC940DRAFT_349524 [Gongronella butleri]|nr:hypothetical protein BC940DRAFT_349524 [Gongronella butleri]